MGGGGPGAAIWGVEGGGGAQAPLTSPCPPSTPAEFPPPPGGTESLRRAPAVWTSALRHEDTHTGAVHHGISVARLVTFGKVNVHQKVGIALALTIPQCVGTRNKGQGNCCRDKFPARRRVEMVARPLPSGRLLYKASLHIGRYGPDTTAPPPPPPHTQPLQEQRPCQSNSGCCFHKFRSHVLLCSLYISIFIYFSGYIRTFRPHSCSMPVC